jgi:DNA primase
LEVAAVAACGTAVTAGQLDALHAVCDLSGGLVVALDADLGGRRATEAVWQLLGRYPGAAGAALAADLPVGSDPAEVLQHHGAGALRRGVWSATVPLVDVIVERLLVGRGGDVAEADLPHRFAVLHRAAAALAVTGRAQDIARLVVYLAGRLDLTYATVAGAVADAVSPSVDNVSWPGLSTGRAGVHNRVAHERRRR